jgi:hypothetical protein
VEDGMRLLRQCLIGLGLKLERLITFFVSGKLQHFESRPKSFNGLPSVDGPFSAGRVKPGYTVRVVDCLVERIATFIVLKLSGHETKFLLILCIRIYQVYKNNLDNVGVYSVLYEKSLELRNITSDWCNYRDIGHYIT